MVTATAPARVVVACAQRPEPADLVDLEVLPAEQVDWLLVDERFRGAPRARFGSAAQARRLRGVDRATDLAVATLLASHLDDDAARPTVLLVLDRTMQRAAHLVRDELVNTVVLARSEPAVRAFRLLSAGRSPARITHPLPPELHADGAQGLVLRPAAPGRRADGPWLRVDRDSLEADTSGLPPATAAAVEERAGLAAGGRTERRLLIGPANYAGQGWAWARAVRRHVPGWDARNVAVYSDRARLRFDADRILTMAEWSDPAMRVDLALTEVLPSSHVLLEAMRPIVGSEAPGTPAWGIPEGAADVRALLASGREVALLFHGSEVRRPSQHASSSGWSPFRLSSPDPESRRLDAVTADAVSAADELGLTTFVSTPDLLDYVPGATWMPVALLPVDFAPAPPVLDGGRPVVLHAPSSSRLKGSIFVDAILHDLHERGLITYRRLVDISPMLIPGVLRQVDVVVDQVVLGNPGVLAAQALAAGRVVVAHLPEHVRARYDTAPPIVEATPLSLRSVILDLLADQDAARAIAVQGPAFARTLHDGRRSAEVLASGFLERDLS